MNLERFLSSRTPAWSELDELIGQAGRRPEQLGAERVRRLGASTARAAADLALARRAFPGDPVARQLEQRVGRARHLVYDAPTRRESFVAFVARDYWRAVRARRVPLLIAIVLLFGSAALARRLGRPGPGAAAGLAPGGLPRRHAAAPARRRPAASRSPSERRLSGEIFTNNIRVTLLAFAAGSTAGIGTARAPALQRPRCSASSPGSPSARGNGRVFFELVTAHGVLELSCIVVAGGGGAALRLGARSSRAGGRAREALAARGARGDRDRARHGAVARPRRADRGLPDADRPRPRPPCWRSASASPGLFWTLVL